ncbi:Hypothetical predicted protein [Mytilus galloprovincialis]|uniref:Uncharacterized protein n=1 Tax=Mytilus galloprovincialis TaxID=29158 RepID=A0A8B6D5Q1_MYTGA|nr:Hypothetical predicted protein [Mytilus galloprovincialis]
MASQNGHTDIVKLLLEKNPNVNLCNNIGWSPLIHASRNGHTDIVRLLLEWNPGPCDKTPLSTSYVNNSTSITYISNSAIVVQSIMRHNADVNAQTFDGGTALYFTAFYGNKEITKLLLENDADCNICTYSKQFQTETYTKHPTFTLEHEIKQCFDDLIDHASAHVKDYVSQKALDYVFDVEANCSPLHIACFMGRKDVVSCLLDYNANINMTKEDGTTPLFYFYFL